LLLIYRKFADASKAIFILLVCFAGDLLLSAQTGVLTLARGFVWLPFALVVPWLQLPDIDYLRVPVRVAILALFCVAFASFDDKAKLQERQLEVADAIAQRARFEGTSQVFIVSASNLGGFFPRQDLTAKLGYQFKTPAIRCDFRPKDCETLLVYPQSGIFKYSLDGVDTLVVKF
jgi:hypothetical protein